MQKDLASSQGKISIWESWLRIASLYLKFKLRTSQSSGFFFFFCLFTHITVCIWIYSYWFLFLYIYRILLLFVSLPITCGRGDFYWYSRLIMGTYNFFPTSKRGATWGWQRIPHCSSRIWHKGNGTEAYRQQVEAVGRNSGLQGSPLPGLQQ